MPKTDWEKVTKELIRTMPSPWRDGGVGLQALADRIIACYTVLTEEDLPRKAWWWVKRPCDTEPKLVYFDRERSIARAFTPTGYPIEASWYNEHRAELKLISEVKPPEDNS